MTRHFVNLFAVVGAALLIESGTLPAASNNPGPSFKEISELIRKEIPDLSDSELDKLAAQGLIAQLGSRAMIISSDRASESGPRIAATRVFDGSYAWIRIARVGDGLAVEFQKAFAELNEKQKLKGLIVDLRFTDGDDYAAAAAMADQFIGKAQNLLEVGSGVFRSHEKANPITTHLAVLVNGQTAVAAEALAAVLRDVGAGLLIGDTTAGRAKVWRTFTLSDGTRLALAGDSARLGSGNVVLSSGVTPDIAIKVKIEDERKYLNDPFLETDSSSAGARPTRPRMSEAQLVREKNGSRSGGNSPADKEDEATVPVVRDPALARGLDLLKGLAIVRPARPL